jgi:anaerobic ribonucleoside-triphosphate reductase activating protein
MFSELQKLLGQPVARIAELLLDSKFERDGVSILGGEPFQQPDALLALVRELRSRGCPHIVCYSGYTLEALRKKAVLQPAVNSILSEIDILIDGAFVESQSSSAGAWTGSGNQRVIEMRATKAAGRIVLYDESDTRAEQN